ncbi:MAG: sulfatase-like hydrolase/transferase, partial [Methanosarcina sp.]|nr:sulfatase-like hydrolase/transferase [Methanosarcina sp.]
EKKIKPLVIAIIFLVLVVASFLAIKLSEPKVNLKQAAELNILLITLDTTRADHLGCYGYKPARTPNLDKLARDGILFDNAYCPVPLTLPSHVSILTGLEPVAHGVRNNGYYLSPNIRTVTQILKEKGYKTAAFVSAFSVDSRFGLDRGFDLYDDMYQAGLPFKSQNSERRAEKTFDRFARWLKNNGNEKFFCWVHYYDPHLPYAPPAPFSEEFSDRPYDGEIAYMDVYVGKILDALTQKGLLENTIIIVAGDHGEGLGDKIEQGHGIFLYEETVRVPLLLYNRKIWPKSKKVESRVGLVDIVPTIIEISGLKKDQINTDGESLLEVIKKDNREGRDILLETFYPKEFFSWSELVGLISGKYKFIQAPKPELYDLSVDPEEKNNLISSSVNVAEEMKKKLEVRLLSLVKNNGRTESVAPSTRDLERLRSLGYLSLAQAGPRTSYPDPKEKLYLLRLVQQAQAYEYDDNYAAAEQVYKKILEEIPDSPASYVNLTLVQARQKKMDEAIATLKKGLEKNPESEILLTGLGQTYLVMGREEEAFKTMKRVLELYPSNVDALTVCAGILDSKGYKEEARIYYKKALAIEPESKFLRTNLAANLASTGKLIDAIEIYRDLIKDFPEDQSLYQFIGIAYSYLGDHEQALSYLKQSVSILPTRSGYFNLAVACQKAGKLKEAIDYYRIYLENSTGDNQATIKLAQ